MMKKITTTRAGIFGPYLNVKMLTDRVRCDGSELAFAIVGDCTVSNWDLPPPPPPMPTQAEYMAALEQMYDDKAAEHGYGADNTPPRVMCALRAGYAGPFQAEGQKFAIWMDTCNANAYQIMAQVLSGAIPQPTIDELLAMMPTMEWPA